MSARLSRGTVTSHGFAEQVTLPTGSQQVSAPTRSTPARAATPPWAAGRSTVAERLPDLGRAPFGNFEGAAAGAGGATVSRLGDRPGHDCVDHGARLRRLRRRRLRRGQGSRRRRARPTRGYGEQHGFAEFIPMTQGPTASASIGINTGAGGQHLARAAGTSRSRERLAGDVRLQAESRPQRCSSESRRREPGRTAIFARSSTLLRGRGATGPAADAKYSSVLDAGDARRIVPGERVHLPRDVRPGHRLARACEVVGADAAHRCRAGGGCRARCRR